MHSFPVAHESGVQKAQEKKGCKCGRATQNPSVLTCRGQRCPCYSNRKACLDSLQGLPELLHGQWRKEAGGLRGAREGTRADKTYSRHQFTSHRSAERPPVAALAGCLNVLPRRLAHLWPPSCLQGHTKTKDSMNIGHEVWLSTRWFSFNITLYSKPGCFQCDGTVPMGWCQRVSDKAATVILFEFTLSIKRVIAEARAFKSFVLFVLVFLHTFRRSSDVEYCKSRVSFGKRFFFLYIQVQVICKAWSLARYIWPHCCGSRYVHMWKIFSL